MIVEPLFDHSSSKSDSSEDKLSLPRYDLFLNSITQIIGTHKHSLWRSLLKECLAIDPDDFTNYLLICSAKNYMRGVFVAKLGTKCSELQVVVRQIFPWLFHLQNKEVVFVTVSSMNEDVRKHSCCANFCTQVSPLTAKVTIIWPF